MGEYKDKQIKKIILLSLLFFLYLPLNGCYLRSKNRVYYDQERLKWIKNIAVLPFYNLTERFDIEIVIANLIMTELVKTKRFNVVEFGDVKGILLENKISDVSTVDLNTLHLLRRALKVDTIITGTIYKYSEPKENVSASPNASIDLNITVIDTKSGDVLWQEALTQKGSSEGYILEKEELSTCFGLMKSISKRLVESIISEIDHS